MGVKSKTFHGARAQLMIDGVIVGVFASIEYGVNIDSQDVYILGRFSAAEIALTGYEVINVSCQGFRVIDNGPHVVASVPKLQELLNHEDISMSVMDRQTGKEIATIIGVRPIGYSTGAAAKSLSNITVQFKGLILSDEDGDQDESPNATKY